VSIVWEPILSHWYKPELVSLTQTYSHVGSTPTEPECQRLHWTVCFRCLRS